MTTDKKSNPRKTKPLPEEWTGMVIRVLVEKNPKRAGSLAHKKFALLKDGLTPAEYLALEAEHALDRPWAKRELKHFIDRKLVELCVPLPDGGRVSAPPKKKA
ncbi:MAG: hypothetical protein O7A64_09770 [Alphaproteobacteria bacterium]|nr:hypothetical protein [Alphaproteobacteria bacterium]